MQPTTPNRFNLQPGLRSEGVRIKELGGVSRADMRRARQNGDLGFVKIGGRFFYTPEHIEAWLRRNEFVAEFSIAADGPDRSA